MRLSRKRRYRRRGEDIPKRHCRGGGSGKSNTGLEKGCDHPVIKKDAVIYAGACVLGPITVGENSIVGANAVVLQDVPPNSLAVGVPAVIKKNASRGDL